MGDHRNGRATMVHPLSVALQLCFYTFACIFIVLFTSLSQKIRSGDSFTGCSQFDRGPFFDRVRLREAPDSSSHSEPAEPAYSKEAYFAMCLIVKVRLRAGPVQQPFGDCQPWTFRLGYIANVRHSLGVQERVSTVLCSQTLASCIRS